MFEILLLPFMQRALVVGVLLAALLALLGVFVVLKRMAFFSEGIAHASLSGVAIGVLAAVSPLYIALMVSVVFALIIFLLENKYKLTTDTAIGIIFSFGMALGVVLMSFNPGYQPELISFLFGNILAIQTSELYLILIGGILIVIFVLWNLKKLVLLSLDKETAYVSGIHVDGLTLALYIVLALSVVFGIKVLGVILVSALLLIPVSISKLLSNSFKKLLILSVVLSEVIVISGIVISFYLNMPTGPVIVLVGSIMFMLTLIVSNLKKK